MSKQHIQIGTGPGIGDGDPLRVAFNKINSNFDELYANTANLSNSVSSVAGRSGAVVLTVQDIVGLTNGIQVINRYTSTVNDTNVGATVISTTSTTVYLAPSAGISASYTIGNGSYDGQTIRFLPAWLTGTVQGDVQNIRVWSDRLYNPTGTNGRYSTTYSYPWYPFSLLFNGQQTAPTLVWDAVGQYWITYPFSYD